MTEDEIKKVKAEGFLVGTEKLAHGVNRRKALEYFVTLLYTATGVGLVGAAIGFAIDECYDRAALLLCISQTVWMLMHLREHRREKVVQGATNIALAMTSMFSGFVGAALQQTRPEEEERHGDH